MKYEGVVFDLDHTLFDRYATLTALAEDFRTRLADFIPQQITVARIAWLLCQGDKKYIYYGWRRVYEYLCEAGMFLPPPGYETYRDTLLSLFTVYAVPFPFTHKVLQSLRKRKLKIGLITNGNGEVQAAKLKLLDLTNAFDEVLLCGNFGIQKPNREPFDEMATKLGIPAEKLLYVGDNPICDIYGSKNAGYTPIEVLTTDCVLPDTKHAELCIKSVKELDGLLNRL